MKSVSTIRAQNCAVKLPAVRKVFVERPQQPGEYVSGSCPSCHEPLGDFDLVDRRLKMLPGSVIDGRVHEVRAYRCPRCGGRKEVAFHTGGTR